MVKKIRIGVVGCGQIAQIMHLPYIQADSRYELTALCDLSRELTEQLGKQYQVTNLYTSYEKMFDDDIIDAVVIATVDHYEEAKAAILADLHVMVEKPLSFTSSEALELAHMAENSNNVLTVGYMKTYDPVFRRFIRNIQENEYPTFAYSHNFSGSFQQHEKLYTTSRGQDIDPLVLEISREKTDRKIAQSLGTDNLQKISIFKLILGLGSHNLAALREAYGPVRSVYSAIQPEPNSIIALIETEKIPVVQFSLGIGSKLQKWDESMGVYSNDYESHIQFPYPYLQQHATNMSLEYVRDGNLKSENYSEISSSFRTELDTFASAILVGSDIPNSLFDGAQDISAAENIVSAL